MVLVAILVDRGHRIAAEVGHPSGAVTDPLDAQADRRARAVTALRMVALDEKAPPAGAGLAEVELMDRDPLSGPMLNEIRPYADRLADAIART